MRRLWFRLLFVMVLLMGPLEAHAQEARRIETGFKREVNRFRWTSVAEYGLQAGKWRMSLENRFLSDAFLLFDDQLRFRDEDRLEVAVHRTLGRSATAALRTRTAWFGLSRAFTQEVYGAFRYHSSQRGWIEPLVGVVWDRRPGVAMPNGRLSQRLDVGPAYGVAIDFSSAPQDGYRLHLGGQGLWQHIDPRRGRSVQLFGSAARGFGAARLTSSARFSSQRRDAYQAASFLNRDSSTEVIEATTSDTLEINLQLDAPLFRGTRLLAETDVGANNRFIRTHQAPEDALFFETNFNRRSIGAEVGLAHESTDVTARLTIEGEAASERRHLANQQLLPPSEAAQKTNLLRQADYEESVFGLRGSVLVAILPRVMLRAMGSSRIVRHDTPEANLDDRDEVSHNGELGLQFRLSRYVQADVRVFGSWYHTVYLNAERSAENQVQRSLRLRPSMRWDPGSETRIRFATEVRANYTVDDYLLPGRRPADQSAREVRFETDVEQGLPGDVHVRLTGSYADLRLGRLLWNEFAEIPFDTLRTYSGWVRLQTGRRVMATIGWRLFVRSDYDRALRVVYPLANDEGALLRDAEGRVRNTTITRPGRRWIGQQGPTAGLTWTVGASRMVLDAWVNMQRVRQRLYGALPEASGDRIRDAARRGRRKLIPTIALTVSWKL